MPRIRLAGFSQQKKRLYDRGCHLVFLSCNRLSFYGIRQCCWQSVDSLQNYQLYYIFLSNTLAGELQRHTILFSPLSPSQSRNSIYCHWIFRLRMDFPVDDHSGFRCGCPCAIKQKSLPPLGGFFFFITILHSMNQIPRKTQK